LRPTSGQGGLGVDDGPRCGVGWKPMVQGEFLGAAHFEAPGGVEQNRHLLLVHDFGSRVERRASSVLKVPRTLILLDEWRMHSPIGRL